MSENVSWNFIWLTVFASHCRVLKGGFGDVFGDLHLEHVFEFLEPLGDVLRRCLWRLTLGLCWGACRDVFGYAASWTCLWECFVCEGIFGDDFGYVLRNWFLFVCLSRVL